MDIHQFLNWIVGKDIEGDPKEIELIIRRKLTKKEYKISTALFGGEEIEEVSERLNLTPEKAKKLFDNSKKKILSIIKEHNV